MKPDELYAQRVLRGSYDVLLKRRKFATAIQVMFAGSLRDEDDRRWTHDDLNRWMNGIFDMPRPSGGGRRATRPFIFRDAEFFAAASRPGDPEEPEDAVALILNGRVEKWLRNILVDEAGLTSFGVALNWFPDEVGHEGGEGGSGLPIHSGARSGGPIRYRSVNCTSSGLAGGLWHAFTSNDADWRDDFARLVNSSLLDEWLRVGGRRCVPGCRPIS